MEQDSKYMDLALELARSARGQTSPNPMVGAVIVKDGTIVGMGAHLRAGEPHAEVHALRMAGEKAQGATVYVTLEPCSHYGKTPPCAEALIAADVRRVVVATLDPNPLVAGRGVEMLRAAGVEVAVGVREEEAKALNEVFFHYIQTRRPFVTVKTASTLDGKIASFTGHSRWITGAEARAEVHELRRQHDAILVGVGTILADDPLLTARQEEQRFGSQPVRVILDSHLRTPLDARVVQNADAKTWIFATDAAPKEKQELLAARGVKVISTAGPIRVEKVLDTLGELGITSLLVEGGQEVNGSFLQARAIQKVVSHIALKLIGGSSAPSPFGGQGFSTMGEAVQLANVTITPIGKSDVQISGYPQWEDQT
ncbi:bifunctional diaminohydroxyphosphoribosylaminopyrimidine deaminase/5-amino-6-(5-phosphoribosylamino)uracil reductase RibD [Brevibacillus sp. RS1.1]|uniref:bifunctional diaminohydroxyphosphoribosylaminopyrimidine deaminase/5-amino-6-(5-phosphoribosylamino)uracil reductase RibD n=1 Tax=Brevibacillus sp. RS1.1 TaxID=2738982 RepID=UPI00156BB64E|nr:bifunctional diaminohydroxyphosphoribosylaminopyrimidine deaminase/5-amino-6-(5-phosphoribosylamino)uracil reductase RibD [Brevibacillus sp. RS1.1]NRR04168.1 bifunctional diaminohydroxyphosphoribosylaminopyrimidine deaminase/5-amino-6-(5-phosphoribosylamino)uracil reductase RibD [Brevibacillus sp. RS1.1]